MSLPVAFAPYIFLGIIAVGVLTIGPIRSLLETVSVGLPFPATETGFGVRKEAVEAYAAFTPLTHPGTFLLLSALFGCLMFKRRDRYAEGTSLGGVLGRAAKDALPVTTSVFILYTSGSTGQPKSVLHTTGGYLVCASMTHQYVFDYHDGNIYWCTADVGWVTGHS